MENYTVAQINTGNGIWTKNDMLLLCSIAKLDPDIITISESIFNTNDPKMIQRRQNLFPNYKTTEEQITPD